MSAQEPRPLKAMPGPPGNPVFGHTLAMKGDLLGFFTAMGRAHPELARIRFFHVPAVSVHAPELVDEVLVRQHAKLRKSWDYKQLRRALGDGLVTSEGDLWRRQRKLIQPSFHHERITRYGAIMGARTERRMAGWGDGQVFDLHEELSRITLEIVAEALFGLEVDDIADAALAAIEQLMERFEALFTGWVPLPLGLPTPANLRMRGAIRAMDEIVYEIIRRRRARGPAADADADLLDRLIAASDSEGGMGDAQLRDELVTLIFAGHETTALALTFALFLLAQHPEAYARLLAEVDALPGTPGAGDLDKLPFTRRVVDEAMRVYPPVWGAGREVVEPFELAGYRIDEGTQVFVTSWITHRDARYFEAPEEFRPDRWLDPTWPKSAYFPFGAGPRKCIGFHFALMEAVLVLATLARGYRFELVDDPAQLDLMPSVTIRPRDGLRVRLRARDRAPSAEAA